MRKENLLKLRYYLTNGIHQLEVIEENSDRVSNPSFSFNVFYWKMILNMIRDLLAKDYIKDVESELIFKYNLLEINCAIDKILDEDMPNDIIECLKETQKNCILAKELI